MQTYIALLTFTEKGAQQMKQTTRRAEAFKEIAAQRGIKILQTYWLNGPYDGIHIFEVDSEEQAVAHACSLSSFGNVKTQTFRAFTKDEIEPILESIPNPSEFLRGDN